MMLVTAHEEHHPEMKQWAEQGHSDQQNAVSGDAKNKNGA